MRGATWFGLTPSCEGSSAASDHPSPPNRLLRLNHNVALGTAARSHLGLGGGAVHAVHKNPLPLAAPALFAALPGRTIAVPAAGEAVRRVWPGRCRESIRPTDTTAAGAA